MGFQEEYDALLRSGLLPAGSQPEQVLWGELSGGRFDLREGLVYLADAWWGFYGRDFEFLTNYAGVIGYIPSLSQIRGPLSAPGTTMAGYEIEGEIEGEGIQRYVFIPDAMVYRNRLDEVGGFFEELRGRVNNLVHPDAQGSFVQGTAAMDAQDWNTAEELLWQAYRMDPRSALPPFYLGRVLLERDPQAAIPILLEAGKRGYSEERELFLLLARGYVQVDQMREAENLLRKVMRTGEDAQAHFLMAEIEARYGRKREALMSLKQAAACAPNDGEVQALLAYRAADFGERNLALRAIRRVQDTGVQHPACSMAQALLAREDGDDVRTVHFLKEALSLEPGFREAQELLQEIAPAEETRIVSLQELEPAPLTEEELANRKTLFLESDVEAACDSIEEMRGHFSKRWATQLALENATQEQEDALLVELHSALCSAFQGQLDTMKTPLEGGMKRDFEAFGLGLAPADRMFFMARLDPVCREFASVLGGVMQYILGLVDGGLFEHQCARVRQTGGWEVEAWGAWLEEQLEQIGDRLRGQLEWWGERYFGYLEEWLRPFLQLEGEDIEEEAEAGYVPPPPTSLHNFREPPPALPETTEATPQEGAMVMAPRTPPPGSRARFVNNPVGNMLDLTRTSDPYQQIYEEYLAAYAFIGEEPELATHQDFLRHVEGMVQQWVMETATVPEVYVRIERGTPKVKIRERS